MSPPGVIIGKCYKRHQTVEFLKFLKEIDDQVPDGLDIYISSWMTTQSTFFQKLPPCLVGIEACASSRS
jgi:hypothetical protein